MCWTVAACGVIRNAITMTTPAMTARVSMTGATMAPPVSPKRVAMISTEPAPTKLPSDQNAWNELMIGLRRADST